MKRTLFLFGNYYLECDKVVCFGKEKLSFCGNDVSSYRVVIVYSLIETRRSFRNYLRVWMEDVLREIPYK